MFALAKVDLSPSQCLLDSHMMDDCIAYKRLKIYTENICVDWIVDGRRQRDDAK